VVKKATPAKKATSPAKKATAKKATAKKATPAGAAKKAPSPAKKAPPAKKATASRPTGPAAKKPAAPKKAATPAKKAPAKAAPKTTPKVAPKAETAKVTSAKKAATSTKAAAPAPKAPPVPKAKVKPAPVRPKTGPYAKDTKFLDEVRELLQSERAIYQEQATSLRAEADSLALEREPGDVQFDEESGEGGTVTVDRERNLALSGQASLAVEEIDDAMARIEDKTYGFCERCYQPIPKPRLRALPYARLCVSCKSGGLSRR